MEQERYSGEHRGLGLFLEELAPIVANELGTDSMLHHAIQRALAHNQLKLLRHARDLFNALPRSERQTLSSGIVREPEKDDMAAQEKNAQEAGPSPVETLICFETNADALSGRRRRPIDVRQEAGDGPGNPVGLRVMVRPNTLPSAAARALRDMADMIEADRRLLSTRFWKGKKARPDGAGTQQGGVDFG